MKLIDHVLLIRHKIEQAFDNRFSRLGFKPDKVEPSEQAGDARRKHIGHIIAIHQQAGNDYPLARKEALAECVFTLFNRLAAIKVMEAKEIFPEIIRTRAENGNLSFQHKAWLEENPEERNAERMGLKNFLRSKFRDLAPEIPIFREDYPYDLLPKADELHDILTDFNAIDDDPDLGTDCWKGDDILGWQYENFNTAEKIALKESGDKTEYDKVSLQSQVYTPRWTVKFLVDNSLGKLYLEMYPDSELVNMRNDDGSLKYLIANRPTKRMRTPKPLTEIRVIDPACGSGNFLIYAFMLLYDMYMNQIEQYGADYSRRDIPRLIIENNLYGIDLDERAAQITQIALLIKAKEIGGRRWHKPERINIVSTHFTLPTFAAVESQLTDEKWSGAQKEAVASIWNDLRDAYKFGSLVRVEEKLRTRQQETLVRQTTLYDTALSSVHSRFITDALNKIEQEVAASAAVSGDDYASRQVNNAMTFLKIISQSYDVAVANPPYTDSSDFGPALKDFINDNYKKPYKVNINLYAVFIKRCLELTDGEGKVAMIHPHTFMYIKTFEDVRKLMIEKTHINCMVDYGLDRVNLFGPGILLDATFYTLDKGQKNSEQPGIYFNITNGQQEKFKKGSFLKALQDVCAGQPNDRVYSLPQQKLKEIKSWPFIYWISDEFREKFARFNIRKTTKVISGFKTGNNNGALRFHWEIKDNNRWKPYTKGGIHNKWYGNNWLTIDTANNFEYIRSQKSFNIPSVLYKQGITYNGSGSKGVTFRFIDDSTLYDMGACCLFPEDTYLYLSILDSKLIAYSTDCLNPTVNVQPGDIERLPFVDIQNVQIEDQDTLRNLGQQNVDIKKQLCTYSLIEPTFTQSPIGQNGDIPSIIEEYYAFEVANLSHILLNETLIDGIVFNIYDLNTHDRQMVLSKEGIPAGSLSVSSSARQAYLSWLTSDENEFKPTEELLEHINNLEVKDDQPTIDDFDTLYQNNNGWEEFCIKHGMNPIEVWWQFKNAKVLPPQRTQVLAFELVTDVMRTVLSKDDDGVIPLAGRLGEEQMSHRIELELQERGYSDSQISQIIALLGSKDLETYLRDRFFQQLSDHLNLFMYLPKTPFIWHLSSGPLHALDVMISIYQWSRNTLTRIKSVYAARRESQLSERLNSIADSTDASRQVEASTIREQLKELHAFTDKIDDLLASGYDPKLDDGVGKNIAPLQQRGMLAYEVLNKGQLKKYLNADW